MSITLPVARLPLSSDAARHKFKLIAGPRWDSDKDELKIACELFPTDRMNEKWCSDMLDRMVAEAEVRPPHSRTRWELTARGHAGHDRHDG